MDLPNIFGDMDYLSTTPTENQDLVETSVAGRFPQIGFIIACTYLILVKMILPKYMENREPYKLKTALRIYDVVQIYLNTKLVYKCANIYVLTGLYEAHCIRVDHTFYVYHFAAETALSYLYLKVLDLFDTVFIVLKKKSSQLSFLHLFHHTMVLTIAYISFSDRESYTSAMGLLNSFVHAVMYSYYFLASFESQKWITKYKKYVTQLQLGQFAVMLLYLVYGLFRGCPWGVRVQIALSIFISVLALEFSRFYYNNYIKTKSKKK